MILVYEVRFSICQIAVTSTLHHHICRGILSSRK